MKMFYEMYGSSFDLSKKMDFLCMMYGQLDIE